MSSVVRWVAASSFLLAVAVSSSLGCGTTGKTCAQEGGVMVAGHCEAKCDPTKCLMGNTCVANRCELICASEQDCVTGQQCASAAGDNGMMVNVCLYTQKAMNINLPCPLGNECDSSFACPNGATCDPNATGKQACDVSQCRALSCLSSGIGDGNAYCTNFDCTKDTDCVDGMYCTVRRLSQNICGTKIGTDMPCINTTDFMTNGATFQEGPISLLRNVCRKRGECAPCSGDLDCSLTATAACVPINGTNNCATTCAMTTDCESDKMCVGASAPTPGFCVPKFQGGTCVGTGNFCEPCLTDLDCAGGGPTMACLGLTGTQKACIDASFSKPCTHATDCPTSPSGKHGACLGEFDPTPSSQPTYHHCYAPFITATNKFECW